MATRVSARPPPSCGDPASNPASTVRTAKPPCSSWHNTFLPATDADAEAEAEADAAVRRREPWGTAVIAAVSRSIAPRKHGPQLERAWPATASQRAIRQLKLIDHNSTDEESGRGPAKAINTGASDSNASVGALPVWTQFLFFVYRPFAIHVGCMHATHWPTKRYYE